MHARARDLHSDGGEEHGFFYDTYCMCLLLTPIISPDSCRIAESTRFEESRVRRVMRTARPADGCAAGTVEQGNSVNILAAGLSGSRRAHQPATTWMDRAVATRGRSTMQQREGVCVRVCVRCVCMRRGGFLPAEAAVVSGKLPGTQCWAHYTTYFVCYQRAIPSN